MQLVVLFLVVLHWLALPHFATMVWDCPMRLEQLTVQGNEVYHSTTLVQFEVSSYRNNEPMTHGQFKPSLNI
jgi:hypothetical protein